MYLIKLAPFFYVISLCLGDTSNNSIDLHLKRFSKVNYDVEKLKQHHDRVRRSITRNIKLAFEAHGRKFNLELVPAELTHFLNEYIEIGDKLVSVNQLQMYEGKLVDDLNSKVIGTIMNGVFIGEIKTSKDGVFYVESGKKYDGVDDAHAIVYHDDDIKSSDEVKKAKLSLLKGKSSNGGLDGGIGCGFSNEETKNKLREYQEKASEEHRKKRAVLNEPVHFDYEKDETRAFKYSKEANTQHRSKRQAIRNSFPQSKDTCELYLKVDPFLYNYVYQREGNKNDKTTTDYFIYYLNQQVVSLNNIIGLVEFYNSTAKTYYYKGLRFKIAKTKIYKLADCSSSSTLTTDQQNLCTNYLDPTTFLNLISLDDFGSYCLGFVFSARDFSDGTLGLAWLGSASSSLGGICEQRTIVQNQNKSLNTGMITLVNFNSRMPDRVSQLTFAHEVGHSLGSNHDNSTCTPGDSVNGNYIMYSRAVNGQKKNNNQYSPCSIEQMGIVLNYKINNENCLKVYSPATCGNQIVEEGEDCDCGLPSECQDSCCNAATCKLIVSDLIQCSPSKGPCCNSSCRYLTSSTVCQVSNDCLLDVTCSGTSALCPRSSVSFFKPDNSTCNGGTQICKNGECTGSACNVFGLEQCYLTGNLSDKNTDKAKLCHLACLVNNVCTDTSQLSNFGSGFTLRPGSPCAGTEGYCDVFSRCRSFNANSVFSRLTSSILSLPNLTINDIKTWAQTYWYVILIVLIVFLLINGLIIFCVTRHMKSDNPDNKGHLRFKETLKNPFNPFRSREKVQSKKNYPSKFKMDSVRPTAREIIPITVMDDRNASSNDLREERKSGRKHRKGSEDY